MSKRRKFLRSSRPEWRWTPLPANRPCLKLASKRDVRPLGDRGLEAPAQGGHGGGILWQGRAVMQDGKGEIRDLHAKIGQLAVEKDFSDRAFARR